MLNLIRREPVRCAYFAVIGVIAGYAAIEQAVAAHPATWVAAIPVAVTALAGEVARAKVTPVASFLSGHLEDKTLTALVDDLSGAPGVSPQVAELEGQIPVSEQLAPPPPPEPVSAASPGVRVPNTSEELDALVEALLPRLLAHLETAKPSEATTAAAPGTGA